MNEGMLLCIASIITNNQLVSESTDHFRLRNDLYCVGWGVKLYWLTHRQITYSFSQYYIDKYKKLNSLKQFLTATRPTSHNWNGKNQKVAITLAARRHNVNMLLSNRTFLIFAVLVVW